MERRSVLRPLAFVACLFAAIWALVIVRWQIANRVPNGIDIALYLVALPLGLLLGFVLLRKGFDAIKQRGQAAAAPVVEAAAVAAPADPALAWQLPLLAAGVQLAAGDDVAALCEAAKAQQRVALHPALKDALGLPIFAAEVATVDVDAVQGSLPDAAQGWDAARLRTLALAETLAVRMLAEHFPAPEPAARTPRTVLTLEWLLPATWADADRQLAQAWLAARLQAQSPDWAAPALALEVHPIADGAAALQRLDELNRAFNRATPPPNRLLLASDSSLPAAALSDAPQAPLYGAQQPEGRIPGEGAAALLLGAAAAPQAKALAQLHRVLVARRDHPVDTPQRLQSDTLLALLRQVRERAGLADDAPALLVGDTDMRGSRTTEAMHFAEHALPELPPAETLLPLGRANGDSGAALALALVAVAAQQAADSGQPALVFSHHDASLRAVALVTPPPATALAAGNTTPSLA